MVSFNSRLIFVFLYEERQNTRRGRCVYVCGCAGKVGKVEEDGKRWH